MVKNNADLAGRNSPRDLEEEEEEEEEDSLAHFTADGIDSRAICDVIGRGHLID